MYVAVLVSLLLIVATSLLLRKLFASKKKGRYVCFVGLAGSGKTLLFTRLQQRPFVRTHTSIKENIARYSLAGGSAVELVDVPGEQRLCARILAKYRNSLKGLVLVVDSVNFPKEALSVAELMYDLLSAKDINKKAVPFLVACNMQDLALARSCDAIKTQLELEINKMRASQSQRTKLSSLEGPGDSHLAWIGNSGTSFHFSDPATVKVDFKPCSARGEGNGGSNTPSVQHVHDWIANI